MKGKSSYRTEADSLYALAAFSLSVYRFIDNERS
jgi:hypothetical protein